MAEPSKICPSCRSACYARNSGLSPHFDCDNRGAVIMLTCSLCGASFPVGMWKQGPASCSVVDVDMFDLSTL